MKKKLLSALLCVAMVASLVVGCGGTTDAPAEDTATEDTATEEEVTDEEAAEPTKIQVAQKFMVLKRKLQKKRKKQKQA